jgi:two-component system OmpR family sensor kinase
LTLDKVLSASDFQEVLAIAASLFADITPAGQIVDFEMKARHADKRQGFIRLRMKAFVGEGESRRVLGIAEDVTDYREVERSALESKLRAARLQMLHTFIEHASHDLRTPLTIIQTNAYLLSKGVQADDKLRDRVDKISEQVHKITDTIDDFLALVRLDQTPGLEVTAISINGLLLRTIHLLRSQMKAVPNIVEHLAADLPAVRGDSTLLQQVFYAVLENAVHYTPLDGEIQVRTAEDNGTVMVEIADTGPGIDPADRPMIFQPMFKGNRFRSNDAGRSGMGLAIAHRIMTLHNGSIEADPDVSQGTLIRIRLPF